MDSISKETFLANLPKTCLDNSYHSDDDELALPGNNIISAGNPNNIKREWVCAYYGEALPAKVINVNILNGFLVCELSF